MRRVAAVVFCTALSSIDAAAQRRLPAATDIPAAELEAFVDGVVRQAMAAGHIAGTSVAVVQGQQVVLKKGYGFADVATAASVNPDTTLFRIGSITKTFTWLALMNASAAGRLRLDDPVNTHLPPELRVADEGFAEPIRIRHLMTHAGGFEDRMFGHLFVRDPGRLRPRATYLRDERPRRVREPGVLHSYSNYGVGLAGVALEQVNGKSWEEIIESEIIEPLRMDHTSVREPYPARPDLPPPMNSTLSARLSKGYRWNGVALEEESFEYISHNAPAGVISSSAGDMARYMLMLLGDGGYDGVQVFDGRTAAALRQPMTMTLPPGAGNWTAGFLESQLPGGFRTLGHDGGSLLFFSSMLLVPELRLGVFVATNTAGGDSLSNVLAPRLVEHFYGVGSNLPPPGSKSLAASASVYEGYYLQTRRPYTGLQAFLMRLLARRVRVTADGYLIVGLTGTPRQYIQGERPEEFTAVDPAAHGQTFRFQREGDRAIRIDHALMAWERVPPLRQPPVVIFSALVVVLASIATLLGSRARNRRDAAPPHSHRIANVAQTLTAVAWLVSAASIGLFAASVTANEEILFYGWPPVSLLTFSAAALLASLLAAVMVALLPAIWRNREAHWTLARRVRYTTVTVLFAAFGALLASWGALQPWNP